MLMGLDSAKDQVLLWGAECLWELLLTEGAEGPQHLLESHVPESSMPQQAH